MGMKASILRGGIMGPGMCAQKIGASSSPRDRDTGVAVARAVYQELIQILKQFKVGLVPGSILSKSVGAFRIHFHIRKVGTGPRGRILCIGAG